MDKKTRFDSLVGRAQKIIITVHRGVDDDAVCSILAVYDYLTSNLPDKLVKMVITGFKDYRWDDLENFEKIEWVPDLVDCIAKTDLLIFLDGNRNDRFTNRPKDLDLNSFQSICIDHHVDEPEKYTEYLGDKTAMATCQIIADLLYPDNLGLSKETGKALLIGILGDSGCFKCVNQKNSSVFLVAKRLSDLTRLSILSLARRFDSLSFEQLEVIKVLLENTTRVDLDGFPGFSYSWLPQQILEKFDEVTVDDAYHRYLGWFVRHIVGYPWGFVVTPRKSADHFKISFRSLPGSVNVRLIGNLFGGGGHDLAGGGRYFLKEGEKIDAKAVAKKVVRIIKGAKLELTPKTD
ncbi:MAG: DHH family phosphoesterase [Patescibacteria group bacterium]